LVDEALADRSHVSLIAWTGSASTRVFQMLLAGNTPQLVPGTSAARTHRDGDEGCSGEQGEHGDATHPGWHRQKCDLDLSLAPPAVRR
jgi:hypothetical protein